MNPVLVSLAVLAGGAIVSLLLSRLPRLALAGVIGALVVSAALSLVAALGVLLSDPVEPVRYVRWSMPIGHMVLGMDGLSAWFVMIIAILSVAAGVYSWGYLAGEGTEPPRHEGTKGEEQGPSRTSVSVGVFGALFCGLVGSLQLVVCARDVPIFLIGWEMMALMAFFLVMHHDRQEEVRRAAWTYLIGTHLGTAAFLLPMFAVVVALAGGQTEYEQISRSLIGLKGSVAGAVFLLGLVGFGTKAGFMPMHVWLPVAHPAAPSPVSAMMSGVVIKTGIYGLLRLLTLLPVLPAWCGVVLLGVGAAGGIMGILYALGQKQLKRMLAFSSVENIGIIAIGIGIGMLGRSLDRPSVAAMGFGGALLHALNHAMFKGLLFLSAGAVLHDCGTVDIERLGGLARKTPGNAVLFFVAAMAICALPPLNGFASEWLIYSALFGHAAGAAGYSAAPAVLGLTALALVGGLALAAFSKVFTVVFLGNGRDQSVTVHRTPRSMLVGMSLLAIMCIGVGVAIWFVPARYRLLDNAVGAVLGGASRGQLTLGIPSGVAMAVALLIVLILGLAMLRRLMPGVPRVVGNIGEMFRVARVAVVARTAGNKDDLESAGTWGCGYPYASPRIQYTGSSFGWSLADSFRQMLRARRNASRPEGMFPGSAQLATHSPDVTMTRFYEPVFLTIARGFRWLWPLQHGRIQLYLMYIVLTLLAVFCVEVCWGPGRRSGPPVPAPVMVTGELQ